MKWGILYLVAILATSINFAPLVWSIPTSATERNALIERDSPKYVFAHFMVCVPDIPSSDTSLMFRSRLELCRTIK